MTRYIHRDRWQYYRARHSTRYPPRTVTARPRFPPRASLPHTHRCTRSFPRTPSAKRNSSLCVLASPPHTLLCVVKAGRRPRRSAYCATDVKRNVEQQHWWRRGGGGLQNRVPEHTRRACAWTARGELLPKKFCASTLGNCALSRHSVTIF